jgi:hypothetical protein
MKAHDRALDRILERAANPDDMRWLPHARLNIAESALAARDQDAPALLWADEAAPDAVRALTLWELRLRAQRFAAALGAASFAPGAATPFSLFVLCSLNGGVPVDFLKLESAGHVFYMMQIPVESLFGESNLWEVSS